MNTDTLPRIRPNDEPPDPIGASSSEPRRFLDLSATQLIAGALAAATAATLGSRLGLAGTIIGAVVASLLTALASAIYAASLRRGREHMRAVVAGNRSRATVDPAGTTRLAGVTGPLSRSAAASPAPRRPRTAARVRLRTVLIGALAIFATASAAITGFELITGHALSGGDATTAQQLGGDQKNPTVPATPVTPPANTATDPATSTAAPTATVTVTAGPTTTPDASSTPSATPSPEPTPSPTPSATDSAPATAPATGPADPTP